MNSSYTYSTEEFESIVRPNAEQSHRSCRELGYNQVDKGFILPFDSWQTSISCIADKDGRLVPGRSGAEFLESVSFYNTEHAEYIDKDVIYIGFLINTFGHTFTDNLSRLWFLTTEKARELIRGGAILAYTTEYNHPLSDISLEILKIAGIDISGALHISHPCRFRSITIPDNSIFSEPQGRVFTKEFEDILTKVAGAVGCKSPTPAKIYLSRYKFSKNRPVNRRREYGEKALENIFRALGYTIIYPERLSLQEQINLAQNCTHLAATEGSVAHISIFCKKGTKLILLLKAIYSNEHQLMINEYADLDVENIIASRSVNTSRHYPWCGPFYLCATPQLLSWALKQAEGNAEAIAAIKKEDRPLWKRPSWIWYKYMRKRRKDDRL